ncbi:MAG: aldehyde dehydrogenase [Proteobacteria bacterium]|nr:aldehyde dehydrogenase [Pseudomonadota bacterium]
MAPVKRLKRRETVAHLLEQRKDALVVTGLGAPGYDVMAAGDHDNNFYLWGAMGAAAMVGLGLALSQRKRPVLVFTGDGEQLMGMGGLATVAVTRPENLVLIVLNNEHYGETGMQRSHAGRGVDLVAVAAACGFANSRRITCAMELDELCVDMHRRVDAIYAEIMIEADEPTRVLPPRDGVFVKNRFRKSLGFATI